LMKEKSTKLAMEVERLSLLFTVRSLLPYASTRALRKVQRTLKVSAHKRDPGSQKKYSNEFIQEIHADIQAEIVLLKEKGKKRPGPKAALRSLVQKVVHKREGLSAPQWWGRMAG
jgi:hypothetical protein